MDGGFAPLFEPDDLGTLGVVHVAQPVHRAADFFVIQHASVDLLGLPGLHPVADRDQVGAGRTQHHHRAVGGGNALQRFVEHVHGRKALGRVRPRVDQGRLPQP